MKKIATMVRMMAFTSASAGEWGKGPSYNGRNYDPNYSRPRGHHNAPGVQFRCNPSCTTTSILF